MCWGIAIVKIAGIVAEYNPFHNGHAYHIRKTRSLGYTHIVAVMSGNYTQRGEPACMEKRIRAEAALRCGADLCIELPLPWAISSAENFAAGSVFLLNSLNCVDAISFGSETGNLEKLKLCASILDHIEHGTLSSAMKAGISFAAARTSLLAENGFCDITGRPNDSLGIEYLRAMNKTGSSMKPVAIQRVGALHDAASTTGKIASASHIRELFESGEWEEAFYFVPEPAAEIYRAAAADGLFPFQSDDFRKNLLLYLKRLTAADFMNTPGVSEGLENRISQALDTARSYHELLFSIKTKRYAMSRIKRILLSAYLGVNKAILDGGPPYLRVLGFNRRGLEILYKAKENGTSLPVFSRFAQLKTLDKRAAAVFLLESRAADLYTLFLPQPKNRGSEKEYKLIKIED